jgi:GNAT superfamily N-acetyltransferase
VIEDVKDPALRAGAAESVLRALPDWFGLEEPLLDYIQAARELPTFVATEDDAPVGFLTLKQQTAETQEILAMGVIKEWHRRGIGSALVDAATEYALAHGARLLEVKTLGPSHPDENYQRTRSFYESLGFLAVEETTALWGPANPCLILVKPLPRQPR